MTSPTIRCTDRVALHVCYLERLADSDPAPLPARAKSGLPAGFRKRVSCFVVGQMMLAGAMAWMPAARCHGYFAGVWLGVV